ncbi:MAG: branched-chain amino acid transport system substrate-binding protein [Gaiellaceae bacterium]|nr:branched-chain amino acid transport system substrate-binding protein [Gaiellaceae bacterium]
MTPKPAALAAALGAALLLAAAGASGADTPGVTATTITLGGTVPISGPAAAFGVVGPGANAYFKYVNDHGGVFKRKIVYKYLDDGYDPAQTVQLTRQLIQQENVLAIFNSVGTEENLAIRPFLNQLKVPQLFTGTASNAAGDPRKYPYSLGYLPSFSAEGAIYARYIGKTQKKARLGVLYENSNYGQALVAGLKRTLPKGVVLSDVERYEVTDTDISSQVGKLRQSKADTFMVFATPKFAILSYIAANKLGWHPRYYVSAVSIEPSIMAIATASTSKQTTEGSISIAFVKDPTSPIWRKDKGMKLFKSIMKRYDPSGRATDGYNVYGMAVAYSMVDTLKHAGKNPTRDSVLRAAMHLNEKNPFLLPGIVVKTSPNDYLPLEKAKLLRYHKGLWVPFGRLVTARG